MPNGLNSGVSAMAEHEGKIMYTDLHKVILSSIRDFIHIIYIYIYNLLSSQTFGTLSDNSFPFSSTTNLVCC